MAAKKTAKKKTAGKKAVKKKAPAKKKAAPRRAPAKKAAAKAAPKRKLMVDETEVQAWIGILEKSALSELEIEVKGTRIRLAKGAAGAAAQPAAPVPSAPPAPSAPAAEEKAPAAEAGTEVKAPMVGTFYSASEPGAAPFVKVGDHIGKGQVICIIEAMKIMNEIESEHDGTVKKVLVKNGDPLEYNQPMFIIE